MVMPRLDLAFVPSEMQTTMTDLIPEARRQLAALQDKTCLGSEWTGWYDYPSRKGFALAAEVKAFVASRDFYHDVVLVIGIGGSYLGTRAVYDSLSHEYEAALGTKAGRSKRPLMVFAGHHLAEAGLIELLDVLEDRQPVVNVISKSGTTTEPGIAFRFIRSYMEKRFGKAEAAKRIIATTDPETGALRRVAQDLRYQTFPVPNDIGGRYSLLSAVGLVPLALAGFDIDQLLAGADGFFANLKDPQGSAALPLLEYASARRVALGSGKQIELLVYGEPKLRNLGEWWKQLFGESEGKDGRGLFPACLTYTTDLHSLGQYVQDGPRTLLETFLTVDHPASGEGVERRVRVPVLSENTDELGYLENRLVGDVNAAALQATKIAHFDGGVPCLELRIDRLDELNLGGLFAFFEAACAVSAGLLGVNAFDQPGVEAYKKNLFGLLGKPGFEHLGSALRRRLTAP